MLSDELRFTGLLVQFSQISQSNPLGTDRLPHRGFARYTIISGKHGGLCVLKTKGERERERMPHSRQQ